MDMEKRNALLKFKNQSLIVWGDFILDEFVYTTTKRVSREAPVLITEYISSELFPGGAGNVVMNLKSLNANPLPVGFIGKDEDGKKLLSIFNDAGINTDGLLAIDNFNTPKKSRILSGGVNTKKQQVLRIDTKNHIKPTDDDYTKLLNKIKGLYLKGNTIIISDYLDESINGDIYLRLISEIPDAFTVVDSRHNLLSFKNADIITPNEPEFKELFPDNNFIDEKDYLNKGNELMNSLNLNGIVFKRGHKGMVIFEKGKQPRNIEIYGSSSIVDVTGAGDTVISVLTLALQSGLSLYKAAELANIAGGIVVMYEGTYPIKFNELNDAVK